MDRTIRSRTAPARAVRASTAVLAAVAALALAGCSATYVRQSGMSTAGLAAPQKLLLDGLKQYEEGDLKSAEDSLQKALAGGLSYTEDRVTAHKYLAFIACATNREPQCREQFAAALALDPRLQLTRAEEGHPMWGPVFKSVKAAVAPGR